MANDKITEDYWPLQLRSGQQLAHLVPGLGDASSEALDFVASKSR
jgi:hypothetical protein